MTYDDLILNNWRFRLGHPRERRVEHLELLVPTVGTKEEQVFYLTQVEIAARLAPLLAGYVRVAAALERDDPRGALAAVDSMRLAVEGAVRRGLATLSAARTSARRLDPVVWARTVAPLAVWEGGNLPGPSGTSSPALALLDELLGRQRFESQLGRESLALRQLYSRHARGLFSLIRGRVDLTQRVEATGCPRLERAWQELRAQHLGAHGFLTRHRIKVFGFIEVAFKVGRSVTIGGFAGPFADRTWLEVDDALVEAAAERPPLGLCPVAGHSGGPPDRPVRSASLPRCCASPGLAAAERSAPSSDRWERVDRRLTELVSPSLPRWSWVDFYRRALSSRKPLIRLGRWVVDVEGILTWHPGGPESLLLYVGRDAREGFLRVAHDSSKSLVRTLASFVRAQLPGDWPVSASASQLGASLCPTIETLFEVRQAFLVERGILNQPLTATEVGAGGPSPLARWHAGQSAVRVGHTLLEGSAWHRLARELSRRLGSDQSVVFEGCRELAAALALACDPASSTNGLRRALRGLELATRLLVSAPVRLLASADDDGALSRVALATCLERMALALRLSARSLRVLAASPALATSPRHVPVRPIESSARPALEDRRQPSHPRR